MRRVQGLYRGLVPILFLFLSPFLCSTLGAAQTGQGRSGQIIGQVRFENDRPAPIGVAILLERRDSGVVAQEQTDSVGKFQFQGLEQRTYKLTVRMHGYETSETYVDLTLMSHQYVQIKLKPVAGVPEKIPSPAAGGVVSARDVQIPQPAVEEFDKGKKLLMERGDVAKSISHFLKAIKIYDRFPQAHVLLGVAFLGQQRFAEAEQSFHKAIQIDDKMPDAYIALGTLENQQKKFADAEKTLSKAAALSPDSFQVQYELGKSYWALRRNDEAELHARKAVQLRADFAPAHVLLGNVALRKNDPGLALKEFNEYLRLEPNGEWAQPVREQITKIEQAAVPK